MADRILWNKRPSGQMMGGGDIDEIVVHNVDCVHIEQMSDQCWWIAIYKGPETDDPYWMGNFVIDSNGKMRFTEQEGDIEWAEDDCHEEVE